MVDSSFAAGTLPGLPGQEREAIAWLAKTVQDTKKLPAIGGDVAETFHVSRDFIYGKWPAFLKAWRRWARKIKRTVKGPGPSGKEDEAIRAFDELRSDRGGVPPTNRQVADRVVVHLSTMGRQPGRRGWERYRKHRARALRELGRDPAKRTPSMQEQKAIDYATQFAAEQKRPPTPQEIADKMGVRRETVYQKWLRLRKHLAALRKKLPKRLAPSADEAAAIEALERRAEQTGRLLPKRRAAATIDVSLNRFYGKGWPTFQRRYAELAKVFPLDVRRRTSPDRPMKEPAAVKFQQDYFDKSGRMPSVPEVAKHVKAWPQTLYAWPEFMAARRALAAQAGGLRTRGRRAWTDKEDQAIGFLKEHVRTAGGVPSHADIARLVRVVKGTVRDWPRYQAARRAEARRLGIYPRVGIAEAKKRLAAAEEKAVAFIRKTMEETGWPPTWAEIADAAERPVGTVKKLPKVQHAYKMGASRVIKRTPWGTPKSVQEARALAYLVEQKTAGSVPSIEQIATGIGAGAFTFRCRPVFRAAYAEAARDGNGADGKIRQQRLQRPAAETGNGAAGDGSVLDAEFKKALEHFGKEIPSGQSATQKAQVVAAWKRDERLTYPGIRDWFRDMVPASEYQVGGGGPGTDRIKKLVKRGCALLGLS